MFSLVVNSFNHCYDCIAATADSYYKYSASLKPETLEIDSLSTQECVERLEDIAYTGWKHYTVDSKGQLISKDSQVTKAFKNVFYGFVPFEKSATTRLWEASCSIQRMMDKVEKDTSTTLTDSLKEKLFDRVRGMFEKLLSLEIKDPKDKAFASLWRLQEEREAEKCANAVKASPKAYKSFVSPLKDSVSLEMPPMIEIGGLEDRGRIPSLHPSPGITEKEGSSSSLLREVKTKEKKKKSTHISYAGQVKTTRSGIRRVDPGERVHRSGRVYK